MKKIFLEKKREFKCDRILKRQIFEDSISHLLTPTQLAEESNTLNSFAHLFLKIPVLANINPREIH